MPTVDAMIARLESELEERNHFVEGLVAGAQDGNRDLNSQEMELIGSARQRITAIGDQLTPLRETSRITIESRQPHARDRHRDAGPAAPGCRAAHRVPLGGRLCGRAVLRHDRRRRGRRAPRGVQPGRRPPEDERQPGSPARVGRRPGAQFRRRRPPSRGRDRPGRPRLGLVVLRPGHPAHPRRRARRREDRACVPADESAQRRRSHS